MLCLSDWKPGTQGYHIIYKDGYETWSPADVFETAYTVSDTALDRVSIEIKTLMEKVDKLGHFIFNKSNAEGFNSLSLNQQAYLIAQLHTMMSYQNLLCLRQSGMEAGVDNKPYGLNFEQALPLLKEGYAIRRTSWEPKNLMVFKQIPAHITSQIIPKMQSLPDEAKRLILATKDFIKYENQSLVFNAETGEANSWTPTISDIFANDWELVTK